MSRLPTNSDLRRSADSPWTARRGHGSEHEAVVDADVMQKHHAVPACGWDDFDGDARHLEIVD
jgi:hypothetical protein